MSYCIPIIIYNSNTSCKIEYRKIYNREKNCFIINRCINSTNKSILIEILLNKDNFQIYFKCIAYRLNETKCIIYYLSLDSL